MFKGALNRIYSQLINYAVYYYRDWKRDEANFAKKKTQYLENLKEQRARIFKDAGNEKFKMEEYEEAAKLYTEALDYAPPSLEYGNGEKKGHKWYEV